MPYYGRGGSSPPSDTGNPLFRGGFLMFGVRWLDRAGWQMGTKRGHLSAFLRGKGGGGGLVEAVALSVTPSTGPGH